MRAVVVGLEKKESMSETPFPSGERLDVWRAGVRVDYGFFSCRCWDDGETINRNEEVKKRNLKSSVWDTQKF